MPGTSPSATIESNGDMVIYYVGNDAAIHLWLWNGTGWQNQTLGGTAMPGTSPAAVPSGTSDVDVWYAAGDDGIHLWLWNGTGWLNQDLGGSVLSIDG